MKRILYGYWRSSASYRIRIALKLKELDYSHQGINLVKGEQTSDDFTAKNSQGLIPLYAEIDNSDVSNNENKESEFFLSQSMAILDYLEDVYPEKPLLPNNPRDKARIKAASQIIACEIHPLDNLRVLKYLEKDLGIANDKKMEWYHHWVETGFSSLEKQLDNILKNNTFSMGDRPGYLEALLIPQVYNANRFNCSLVKYPRIVALNEACMQLPEFITASPENQPDAH